MKNEWYICLNIYTKNLYICCGSSMLCLIHNAQVRPPLHRRTRHKWNEASAPQHWAHETVIKLAPQTMHRASENILEVVLRSGLAYIELPRSGSRIDWLESRDDVVRPGLGGMRRLSSGLVSRPKT
jgi:hypothetical protein